MDQELVLNIAVSKCASSDETVELESVCILEGQRMIARVKQQDATLRIGAQSRRKNRVGRAAAYKNGVEGLFG